VFTPKQRCSSFATTMPCYPILPCRALLCPSCLALLSNPAMPMPTLLNPDIPNHAPCLSMLSPNNPTLPCCPVPLLLYAPMHSLSPPVPALSLLCFKMPQVPYVALTAQPPSHSCSSSRGADPLLVIRASSITYALSCFLLPFIVPGTTRWRHPQPAVSS
jgi:hypothetical protein